MIITGEVSGDIHGANLVKAMKELDENLAFYGMGGENLALEDVEILYDSHRVSVVGLFEVLSHAGSIFEAQNILKRRLKEHKTDLLILIDFPDFNLLIAQVATKLEVPVFYYIPPQVWAWREGRIKKIEKFSDTVGVILPFEQEFFRERGVNAEYVGHPLLDSVAPRFSSADYKKKRGVNEKNICIGIIPGSREKEVRFLLSDFVGGAITYLRQTDKPVTFIVPKAQGIAKRLLYECGCGKLLSQKNSDLIIEEEFQHEAMQACDVVIATSGTVTLELAILDIPMIVCYRINQLTYYLARLLVKVKFFSLVNLIAERQVVKELLQDEVNPEEIARQLYSLLHNQKTMKLQKQGLFEVRARLGGKGASQKAAELALKTLHGE